MAKENIDKAKRDTTKKLLWVAPVLTVLTITENVQAAQSWNPGQGNLDHYGDGNGGPPGGAPRGN